VVQAGRGGGCLGRGREPGGSRPAPRRNSWRWRGTGGVAVRRQDRQVVAEEDLAGRGAVVQAARDRREVLLKPREALIGRLRVTEPGGTRLGGRERPQR